ncbi:MAG: DUF5666 domain-containing protein, partial [Gammaproteobacteria bacterium]|nr:DUF5666 domain-containing protein [Gammaproteobacteria bacterium]
TVHIDKETIFKSNSATVTSYDTIDVGNIVEVSGFSDSTGNIYATRIEVKADVRSDTTEIELKGIVTNYNSTTGIFTLGTLQVNAQNATFKNMQASDLADGILVKVKSASPLANGILLADEIKLKEKFSNSRNSEEIEIEGVVTDVVSSTEIYVNGRHVLIDNNTEVSNLNVNNLNQGMRIKVHGMLDENSRLLAQEIEGQNTSKTSLEGAITAVNVTNRSFTLNGMEFFVSASTRYNDDSESDDYEQRYFNFANLNIGDQLELSFYVDSNGKNIITKLERKTNSRVQAEEESSGEQNNNGENPGNGNTESQEGNGGVNSEWESQGTISDIDTSALTFTFDGILVDYSRITDTSFITDNVEAEIHGVIENGIWYATEIDIEH